MIRFSVPLPDRALHPNSRPHWAQKARAARRYRETVAAYALLVRPDTPYERCAIRLHFHLARKVKPDDDNSIAWMKAGFDALQDAGIVGNDRDVTHLKPTFQKDADQPRVEFEVIPQ